MISAYSQAIPIEPPSGSFSRDIYHYGKWYWDKVQEELDWEEHVRREVEEEAAAHAQPEAAGEPAAAG